MKKPHKNNVGQAEVNKSSMAIALESGNDIRGLIGYIPLENEYGDDLHEDVYIQVKCLGLRAGDSSRCQLSIIVSPISGAGEIEIRPCNWLDSLEHVGDHRHKKMLEIELKKETEKILRGAYLRHRKENLWKFVKERMSDNQQRDFWANYRDEYDAPVKELPGSNGSDAFRCMTEPDIRKLAKAAVSVVLGIYNEDDED